MSRLPEERKKREGRRGGKRRGRGETRVEKGIGGRGKEMEGGKV